MIYEISEKNESWEDLLSFIKEKNLNNNCKVVIDIYGPFCGPCKKIEKILEEIEKDNVENLCVLKMNLSRLNTKDFMKKLISEHKILSVPKILLYEFSNKELSFKKNIVNLANKKTIEKEIFS